MAGLDPAMECLLRHAMDGRIKSAHGEKN